MVINTQYTNYFTRGLLFYNQNTNTSIGGISIKANNTKYSTRGMVFNTQDTNYSTRE